MYRDRTIQFVVRIDRHKARFTIRAKEGDGPVFDATAVPSVEDLDALSTTDERGFYADAVALGRCSIQRDRHRGRSREALHG